MSYVHRKEVLFKAHTHCDVPKLENPLPCVPTCKGGDTIRQIQVQSGAHVELHRGTQPNPDEKLFNVRGNAQQIQLAQQLIRQKYENVPGSGAPQYGPGYVCVLYISFTMCIIM